MLQESLVVPEQIDMRLTLHPLFPFAFIYRLAAPGTFYVRQAERQCQHLHCFHLLSFELLHVGHRHGSVD